MELIKRYKVLAAILAVVVAVGWGAGCTSSSSA